MRGKKLTLNEIRTAKNQVKPISWITCYDFCFANALEKAGIDMILVGDSGGMVNLGYQTTNPVTMNEMISMANAVRRGAPNTFIVGDMPQGSYEINVDEATRNALRFIKEASCDAVKLEGGKRVTDKIRNISNAGILVFGHLGLTPQSVNSFGGYRVQGKTIECFEELIEDALAIQEAGACALLLEAIPTLPAGVISKKLKIPVYGIGAGSQVDGQLIILHDMLGLYPSFRPHFAKCYVPQVMDDFLTVLKNTKDLRLLGKESRSDGILELAKKCVECFIEEINSKKFPTEDYSYPISDKELTKLQHSKYWPKESSTPLSVVSI
jgi:3-methyl-2-oxobutanoate hydroxymethyltransferase